MTPIKKEKDEIRSACAVKRNAIPKNERDQMSMRICDFATNLISFRHSDIILLYAPIKSEVDVMPIMKTAIEKGKRVAFPRCNTEDRTMKFHFVTSEDDFETGAYGIREPKENCEIYDTQKTVGVSLCFVPGLAFDSYGYRLGYGKGYYDKFICEFTGSTVGIVFSDFILPSLPRGRFDRHCDVLLTEKGIKQLKAEKR